MVHATQKAILLSLAATFNLLLVVVVAGHIGNKIGRPATKLLVEQMESRGNWCLFSQLGHLVEQMPVPRRIALSRFGNEHHVTLHISGAFVMFAVRNLPGEIRDQKKRVTDPAHSVIQRLTWREGLMTALVGKNPQSSCEQPLKDGV